MPASLTFLRRLVRLVLLLSRSNRHVWLRRWIEARNAATNWEHRARCAEESLDLYRRFLEAKERELELIKNTVRGLSDLRRQRRLPCSVLSVGRAPSASVSPSEAPGGSPA